MAPVHSINIARLRDSLCACLARVQKGEEYIIRDRNRPVAKLVPLPASDAMDDAELEAHERHLVATGQMRLPKQPLDIEALMRMPAGRISSKRLRAIIAAEREDGR